jgi:hypothetical protein
MTRRKAALGHLAQPALVADFCFSRPAGFDPKQPFADKLVRRPLGFVA